MERYCRIPIPHYLQEWQGLGGLILLWLLVIMATQEPMFWCLGGSETLFTTACAEGLARRRMYSVFSSPLPELLAWVQTCRDKVDRDRSQRVHTLWRHADPLLTWASIV